MSEPLDLADEEALKARLGVAWGCWLAAAGSLGVVVWVMVAVIIAIGDFFGSFVGCGTARDELTRAAADGDTEEVAHLISFGEDINKVEGGASPVYCAAEAGEVSALETLLEAGADPDLAPKTTRPVVAALEAESLPTVRVLLDAGARWPADLGSLLVLSVASGDADFVDLVLRVGADADSRDDSGSTPLIVAAKQGDLVSVEVLLASGADPQLRGDLDRLGEVTPLITASYAGHGEVVGALLEAGAYPNQTVSLDRWVLAGMICSQSLDAPAASSSTVDQITALCPYLFSEAGVEDQLLGQLEAEGPSDQVAPLLVAASGGHEVIVEQLLAAGADPNAVSFGLLSPLLAAAHAGDTEAVAHLLAAGADPDLPLPASTLTPAAVARSRGYEELALVIEAAGRLRSAPQSS